MKVKATKKGFDGTAIREEGDVFDMPDTTTVEVRDEKTGKKTGEKKVPVTGSWFEPVKASKAQSESSESLV